MKFSPLKILSYNIHKGFSPSNRKFILEEIRHAIRRVHADVVLLQEVHGQRLPPFGAAPDPDWPAGPHFEFLAEELWPHFAYGKNAITSVGHHGNAILSKYPFLSWENIDISTNRLEHRGLLHGTLLHPASARPVHVICVHLGLLESGRRLQLGRICDRIESHVPAGDPLVIGGDFNDWRLRADTVFGDRLELIEAHSALHGGPARTFPSWLPAFRLDRIYCRNCRPTQARCLSGSPWNDLSDHAAVFAELALE
jgi:endonuclease/exonuclease/phosphatase family metal-dependent hydrolase